MKNSAKLWRIIVIGSIIAAELSFAGCATTVPIKSVRMPTINGMDTVKNLGIRDFENRSGVGGSIGAQVTNRLSNLTKQKIMNSGKFTIVAPNDPNADGVFYGEVRNIGWKDTQDQRSYKDKEGNTISYVVYTRDVSVEFLYGVINTRTNMPFGIIPKKGSLSRSANDNPSKLPDVFTLAESIVNSLMSGFEKDIIPTIVVANRQLMKETSKDKAVKQLMKMAETLVKNGNLEEALRQYEEIESSFGSVAARINAGILRESITSDTAASAQMAQIDSDRAGLADRAIKSAIDMLNSNLSSGARITIMKTNSTDRNMIDYVVDKMITTVVQAGRLTVVDRSNQALIDAEQQFQLSGNVSDDSAVSIGRQLGVKYAVLCWISGQSSSRKLNIRILDIETAQITNQTSFDI